MADDNAQQGPVPWWAKALEKYGLPTVLLIAGASAFLTGVYRVGQWIAPLVEKVTVQHIETMKNTDAATTKMVQTQLEIADTQKQQASALESISEAKKQQTDTLQAIQRTQESIDATLKRLPMQRQQPDAG